MTTLDVDVADVETAARPAARSADAKAAVAYLIASGATAIFVTERDGVAAIRTGKLNPAATAVYWIAAVDAKAVVNKARKLAGRSPPSCRGG